MDVRELVAHDHHTVILGEAGAGKTTVLRRLMLDAANHAIHILNTTQQPVVLPIFVKLNALTSGKTMESIILNAFKSHDTQPFTTEVDIINLLKGNSLGEIPIHSILFLLDGLNEMPSQDKTRPELNRFIGEYRQHRLRISVRSSIFQRALPIEGQLA